MDMLKRIEKQVSKKGTMTGNNLTIKPNDKEWSKAQKAAITEFAKQHNDQRSPERLRKNEMLAVKYRMEHYLSDERITFENVYTIEDFVMEFLKVLGIKKRAFAKYLDIDDSNLNKYYKSSKEHSKGRRFNTELALKFAYFFHTPADIWLKVQIKNELLELQDEKDLKEKYSKYDYEKLFLTI